MKDSYSSHAVSEPIILCLLIPKDIILSAVPCETLLLTLYLAMESFYHRFRCSFFTYEMDESTKLRAWRACVFACWRAYVKGVLTCLGRLSAYVLACLAYQPARMLTCLTCSSPRVLNMFTYLRVRVQHACLFYVLTCSHILHACYAQICHHQLQNLLPRQTCQGYMGLCKFRL